MHIEPDTNGVSVDTGVIMGGASRSVVAGLLAAGLIVVPVLVPVSASAADAPTPVVEDFA